MTQSPSPSQPVDAPVPAGPPGDLAAFIVSEVARQGSEEAVRKLVEKKIGDTITGAVDEVFRAYGGVGKQIREAVGKSLELSTPLDMPAYGHMVMVVLRQQMDAVLTPLVNEKLAKAMGEILRLAPAEVKLSEIVAAMKDEEDLEDRFGTSATVIVEESETSPGYRTVFMDPEPDPGKTRSMSVYGTRERKWACALRFSVNREGEVYSLHVDGKDAKTTIVMGYLPPYQRMVFAAYACGGRVIVDGADGDFDTGYGDV